MNASEPHTEISDPELLPRMPVVSVLMLAYNHEAWIGESIEGVLAQECDFDYELIIGEDGSTDGTRTIAVEYQKRYPDRIRVVYPERNGGFRDNHRRIFALSRGEFVAYCEGDDYWCRRDKLAAQVSVLRQQPLAATVHADWVKSRRYGDGWVVDWDRPMHKRVPVRHLQGNLFSMFYFPRILRTCTVMMRRSAIQAYYDATLSQGSYRFLDAVMSAYATSRWPVAYWPEIASVYRESPNSALRSGRRAFLSFLRSSLEFDSVAREFFSDRADYPTSYRWENDIGLLFRGLQLGDAATMRAALGDLSKHYGPYEFVRAGLAALRMRWPVLRAKQRQYPPAESA